jgi:hypothetical protein
LDALRGGRFGYSTRTSQDFSLRIQGGTAATRLKAGYVHIAFSDQ